MLKSGMLVTAVVVNAYLLAVMVLFATVVYPGFGAVEKRVFPALYSAFTGRIGLPVVAFEFLALVATLTLYAARPASTPAVAVHVLLALGVAYFAITFGWHLPTHRALAAGDNDATALAPLVLSQWARTAVQLVRVGLLGWLGARAMG